MIKAGAWSFDGFLRFRVLRFGGFGFMDLGV